MHRTSRATPRVLATALAACAFLAAPAAARAAERPAPGCLAMNFQDETGDPREAGSGLDVTGGFITLHGRTAVVNVSFADLDFAAYPQPDDLYKTVRVLYTVGAGRFVVQGTFSRLGPHSYAWGQGTRPSNRSSGMAHPGPGGVVEMDLPNVPAGATVTIGEIRTESYKFAGVEYEPDQSMLRRTMDLAQGTTQALACPGPPAPAPVAQQPAPAAPAEPAGQPAAAPAAAAAEPVTRQRVTLRAGRLRAGRVRLRGRTAGVAEGARVQVRRGRRVVGRAVVRGGRFSVTVRRIAPGARLRVRVAGLTSAPVRIRR